MPANPLRVTLTRRLPAPVEARMAELFDLVRRDNDAPMTRPDLAAAMRDCDVLVPTIIDRIDAGLIGQAGPSLKLIANYGAGFDHNDVATARTRGILVSNTQGVSADDTADLALALILALIRRLPEGLAAMQKGDWPGWSPLAHLGGRLSGRRLGVLGLGRVGQAVAQRARAFGCQIHYHNRRRLRAEVEAELPATFWPDLDAMLARIDILSINCPLTPATFHLLDARRLKLMKPTAVIVNTARGGVIDENALTRALRAGALAGAGLDVCEIPAAPNPALRTLPNVILLPHMASATAEGRIEMGEKVILNIKTFADGHRPPDLVVPGMG